MKTTSTDRVNGNMIFKGHKLTIGLGGENHSGTESGHDTGSDETDLCKDTAESHGPGDWDTFPWGQPAVHGAGIRSNRGARAKGIEKTTYYPFLPRASFISNRLRTPSVFAISGRMTTFCSGIGDHPAWFTLPALNTC
jgi:hypothetical protein